MKKLLLTVAMLVAIAFGGHATAEATLQQGEVRSIRIIGCDELDQAQTLVGAWEDGGWAGYVASKKHFGELRNALGQPSCGLVAQRMTPQEQYSEHSVIGADNRAMTVYLIRFVVRGIFNLYAISYLPIEVGTPA